MHNKAMVVDGAFAIIGGRNIADEYYQIGIDHEFADFDLFVAGEPVRELSSAFDLYWNDQWTLPLSTLVTADDAPLAEALQSFRDRAASDEVRIYRRAEESTYLADVREGRIPYFEGRARAVVDDPAKLRTPPGQGPFIVGEEVYQTMNKAKRDVLVLTPYFVPEEYGADFFEALVARGVRVRIVTNSLASTNHAYVHGAYARYRDRLLRAGVEFLEVRSDAAKLTEAAEADLTMHTKLVVVEDRYLFVGSTILDPRSIRQNTEIGIVIESPALAENIRMRLDDVAPDYAFDLDVDESGQSICLFEGAAGQETFRREPLASGWRVFVATVAGWLPIESQL